MPSDKKRINLTVPDNIYEKLQAYKAENGLESDATACLQLVVQQLNARESGKTILKMMQEMPLDVLMQNTKEGYEFVKDSLNKLPASEKKKLLSD